MTVIGAVTACLPRLMLMTTTSTNTDTFRRFINNLVFDMRAVLASNAQRPILILDNHGAHRNLVNLSMLRQHFDVEFQPSYSSPVNSIETAWALIKKAYLEKLYRRDKNLATQRAFVRFLEGVLKEQRRVI